MLKLIQSTYLTKIYPTDKFKSLNCCTDSLYNFCRTRLEPLSQMIPANYDGDVAEIPSSKIPSSSKIV